MLHKKMLVLKESPSSKTQSRDFGLDCTATGREKLRRSPVNNIRNVNFKKLGGTWSQVEKKEHIDMDGVVFMISSVENRMTVKQKTRNGQNGRIPSIPPRKRHPAEDFFEQTDHYCRRICRIRALHLEIKEHQQPAKPP
ncbi:hypothetical protein L5515_019658 [Caenorhabditis briggsae]|uniref:Uncharacterized protein n=1 Tax=Caenorhabditis briggsae TaxID=6238 RepID=A0AAE9JVN9_CAEBR|nr:hypothetical protein L5515_019658 [Caenorhabditis briggsae]